MRFGLCDCIYWTLIDLTTSNYSAIANSHTVQLTRAHTEIFSVCCVFTGCPITAFNHVLCFRAHVLSGWRLSHNCRLSTRSVKLYSLGADPTENTVPLLMDCVTTPLPIALLLLRDFTTDVTCSSVACIRAIAWQRLYVLQYCNLDLYLPVCIYKLIY
jgi:hypothetical protein